MRKRTATETCWGPAVAATSRFRVQEADRICDFIGRRQDKLRRRGMVVAMSGASTVRVRALAVRARRRACLRPAAAGARPDLAPSSRLVALAQHLGIRFAVHGVADTRGDQGCAYPTGSRTGSSGGRFLVSARIGSSSWCSPECHGWTYRIRIVLGDPQGVVMSHASLRRITATRGIPATNSAFIKTISTTRRPPSIACR